LEGTAARSSLVPESDDVIFRDATVRGLLQSGTRNFPVVTKLMHPATAALTVVIEIPSIVRKF